jgi:thiamine-phosphate pyrophosphorylase
MDKGTRRRSRWEVRLNRKLPRLFIVTDDAVVERPDFHELARGVLEAADSRCALQIRAQRLDGGRFLNLARQLGEVASRSGAGLWINDRVDVALAVRAGGLQLGSRSVATESARRLLGRDVLIGRSIHSAEEAFTAEADVLVLGNLYLTDSHPERAALGLAPVREAADASRPIVGIGGITPERTGEVIEAGAWGIAVVGGIWHVPDPIAAVGRYLRALETAVQLNGLASRDRRER